jgi:hypothetical protein
VSTLASLLSDVVSVLQGSGYCGAVRVLETHAFSARQFALKVRAELVTDDELQIRVYRNGDHIDYSYQLLRGAQPIMRWDNIEHFPDIASHPHHFHCGTGEVQTSPLTGDVTHDLPNVFSILFPGDRA